MYTSGFTLAQTATVVPLAWAGGRFDKRTVLLLVIGLGAGVYALFPIVDSSASFMAIRVLQGIGFENWSGDRVRSRGRSSPAGSWSR